MDGLLSRTGRNVEYFILPCCVSKAKEKPANFLQGTKDADQQPGL